MSARDNYEDGHDFECGPCGESRISASAVVFCTSCKDAFCGDCSKIHRATSWAQNHTCVKICDIKQSDCSHLKMRRKPQTSDNFYRRNSTRVSRNEKDLKDAKSRYIHDLKSKHDHSKEELPNEMFCLDHRSVFCDNCKMRQHLTCTKSVPISKAVEDIKKSKEPASLAVSLRKYNVFAKEMVDDRVRQEKFLDKRKKELILKISSVREKVNKYLDEIEGSLLMNLLNIHESNKLVIRQTKDKCAGIQRATEAAMMELRDVYSNGTVPDSRYLKTVLRVRERCQVYEKCLKDAYDSINNTDYVLEKEKRAEEWVEALTSIKSLGTIKTIPTPSTISAFLFVERKNLRTGVSTGCNKLEISSQETETPVFITSIKCVSSGDIFVVDRCAPALELVDSNSGLLMAYKLECLPWDFTLLPGDEVAITIPGEKTIKIFKIDYNDCKFIPNREIYCQDECWGITTCEDKIYITVDVWKPTAAVKILSLDGAELGSFKDQKFTGPDLFKAPQHIACNRKTKEIYVSDSGRHAVTAFDSKGNLKFGFMSRDMGYPTGLVADDHGNVFVCAKETKNVLKILPGFKEWKVIVTEKDGIRNARAISLHPNKSHILVANSGSGTVLPFKIT